MVLAVFKGDVGIVTVIVLGVVVIAALVVVSRVLLRDMGVRRTRFGWFIERDRYEEEPPWPLLPPKPEERTLPSWGDQPTEEKKPDA